MSAGRPHVVVIGGGITGLTAAFELTAAPDGPDVTVLEADDSAGGKVAVHRADGYQVDLGPNAFIDNGTDTRTLAEALGLGPSLVRAADTARERFMLHRGRLVAVPTSVAGFLGRAPLTPWAKARALAEPLVGRGCDEESVHGFLARRFGRGAADLLAGPLVHGVTAGDPRAVSLDAAFPRLRALEREHRSLLLAGLRARRRARSGGAAPASRMTSFHGGGMRVLVDTLADRLGERLRTGWRVSAVEPVDESGRRVAAVRGAGRWDEGGGRVGVPGEARGAGRSYAGRWRIAVRGEGPLLADHVVLAVPAPAAARLLGPLLPEAADLLAVVRHAPVRVLALGYRNTELAAVPRGFGYLTLPGESTRILGTVHSSTIFPGTAPPGHALLRAFAGGVGDAEFATLPGPEAVAAAHRDFASLYAAAAGPVFQYDHVWDEGIPQYDLGHGDRIQEVLRRAAAVPGLHLAGSTYHGVAVNDCVRDGRRAATEILTALRRPIPQALPSTSGDPA